MKWYNRWWKWPIELYDDIRVWRIVRKTFKQSSSQQMVKSFPYEMRMDRIGRIYTVINVPDNILNVTSAEGDIVWPWVLSELRKVDDLMMKLLLNDVVYPDVSLIPGTAAYLVVLTPQSESLSIWNFLLWILNLGIWTTLLLIANSIFSKFYGEGLFSFLINLF